MTILITGAAGNLGSMLARHLVKMGETLHLMIHNSDLPDDIAHNDNVHIYRADCGRPETLAKPCENVDCAVHFAGKLFSPWPERFLPTTNTLYFKNLVDAAVSSGITRIILISFPHVEGESTPDNPARGSLDGRPDSAHARTRLDEEKYLFARTAGTRTTPVVLRAGMVYGKGVLMIEAARWLAERRLLGVWRKKTWIHLVSARDFLDAVTIAATHSGVSGIYHIGDDGVQTLQEFLDLITEHWGYHKPWRLPVWMIYTAACLTEIFSLIFRTKSPLTRDFIRIGMQSYYGDTNRMKKDLLPNLAYRNIREGIETL